MGFEVFTVLVWVVANAVYIDLKRKGERGFGRLCAFWMGTPATWAWFFLLTEGEARTFTPPPDDEAALLREIRRDRALRSGDDRGETESPAESA